MKLYVVRVRIMIFVHGVCQKYEYENHGVYTDPVKADELAKSLTNTYDRDGFVIEIESDCDFEF